MKTIKYLLASFCISAASAATGQTVNFTEEMQDKLTDSFIQHYYKEAPVGHIIGSNGFWNDAEIIETFLDAYETSGDPRYEEISKQLILNFIHRYGREWSDNAYNDDITWMVLALVRAHKYFNEPDYLDLAKSNFAMMYDRAIQPTGTLRWCEEASDHGTNSCINGPAIVALCYLYEMTGEKDYLDKAQSLWNAQYYHLCDLKSGHVKDCGEWSDDWKHFKIVNQWGSTYNQGTMLGSAVKLYALTGDPSYMDYADKVYEWSFRHLTTKEEPHIINVCQTAVGDLCGFKGILARYVRLYAKETLKEAPLDWLAANALHAYGQRNSSGIVWSKWMTPTPDDFKSFEDKEYKDFGNNGFGASTALSAAYNAHINRKVNKNASSPVLPIHMDDIQWARIDKATDTTAILQPGGGMMCRNVDFGAATPSATMMKASGENGGKISVYLDKIHPTKVLAEITPSKSIKTLTGTHKSVVEGQHTVFVVNTGNTPVSVGELILAR